jgi:hypothetical protein
MKDKNCKSGLEFLVDIYEYLNDLTAVLRGKDLLFDALCVYSGTGYQNRITFVLVTSYIYTFLYFTKNTYEF